MFEAKIKKHFSLFMVSKSIHKPKKKNKSHTTMIVVQSTDNQYKKCMVIPRFLDPFNCYHIYGDICFHKYLNSQGEKEIGILSTYNHFKRVINIEYCQNYISLNIDKTNDELHSWEFLISRLESLNLSDAHHLAEVIKEINTQNVPQNAISQKAPTKENFHLFINEINQFCDENADKYFSMFRFQVSSIEKGMELKELRHSKRSVEFFAGDMDNFAHLVLEQGIQDMWCVYEKDYFHYMAHSLKNFLSSNKTSFSLFANTMEGFKVAIKVAPIRKMFIDESNKEIVMFIVYEVGEKEEKSIKEKRDEYLRNKKKSLRDAHLEQTLNVYYNRYLQPQNGYEKAHEMQNLLEYGNPYLLEKKRCGIKKKEI